MRIFLRILALGFLFLVTFGVFSLLWIAIEQPSFERKYREKVGIERPHLFIFPAVVITAGGEGGSYKAQIVLLEDFSTITPQGDNLADFTDKAGSGYVLVKNSPYSFLIPQGQENFLNRQIAQNPPVLERTIRKVSFKVTSLDKSRQFVKVSIWYGDRVDVVWYEATDRAVTPKYFFHYSKGGYWLISQMKTFAVTVIVWIVGLVFYRKKRRRSRLLTREDKKGTDANKLTNMK